MKAPINGQAHPTCDEVLSLLAQIPGAIGHLIRIYPGVQDSDDTDWLEVWFVERINKHFSETLSPEDQIIPDTLPATAQLELLAQPIRLLSMQCHFFRGFRHASYPIRLDGDLTVIDGRNTSGKTSLAEALEWLLTGCLSRRESMDLGSPHELENCVNNQFRPEDDETWVIGTFILQTPDETKTFTLKRVLKEDYGITIGSRCTSILLLDEEELTPQKEIEVLDRLFASEPPLLMQHTLRLFVESEPKKRRQYFERLLHLEELTNLISKAVIGNARLSEFPSLTGSIALQAWDELESLVKADLSMKAHKRISRLEESDLCPHLMKALIKIANYEFPDIAGESSQIEEIGSVLANEQSKFQQKSFPLLTKLRPQREIIVDQYQRPYSEEDICEINTAIRAAWENYEAANKAAQFIGDDRLTISRALKILLEGNAVRHDIDTQTCPICAYEIAATLSLSRIEEIESWIPTQEAESAAYQSLQQAMNSLLDIVGKAVLEYEELLPVLPSVKEFEEALEDTATELKQAVEGLCKVREEADVRLAEAVSQARELISNGFIFPANMEECEEYITHCKQIIAGLDNLPRLAQRYRDALRTIETAVGAIASIEPAYRLRAAWLACYGNIAAISADLQWEQAKRRSQKDLERIRDALIEYRNQFLESRRNAFNEGIDTVWNALRSDRYSSFSKLHIPPPSGRGFPVEIEIKALLDDGQQQKEVDALRVFSESQVNALGISAFVTRSKLLGHKMLIFDDPVQSMDEEHFKTFAENILTHVLKEGFQVILLTHNDMFARDISHYYYDHPGYVTMSVRHSRRDGCVVEEGNRRFSERLKLAEKKIDDGEYKRSWELIREAIERLYTVLNIKYGPTGFNPDSWKDQTANYMWDSGVGEIIDEKIPDTGVRLKDILDMSAAGSHDKSPRGETDLRNSIDLLRSLPKKLGVGG